MISSASARIFSTLTELENSDQLAFYGGESIRPKDRPWPQWPVYTPSLIKNFQSILDSRCWSISSNFNGHPLRSTTFAEEFANYNGVKYCVPTDHGSSAIIAALNAIGIEKGDEVILTGLTWVACPISIIKAGGKPVMVDIDPNTQCMDPKAFISAITPKTKAVLVVHLYNSMAKMDDIMSIAKKHNLAVIEDCAQAHGAEWMGHKAGSIGHIGVFSFQHGKPLASGEGGAVITSDEDIFFRLQQSITHGRILSPNPIMGHVRLDEVGSVMGGNMALPEFQAAILLDSLPLLDQMNEKREQNAKYLDESLSKIPGLFPIKPYPSNNKRSYYHYSIRFNNQFYPNISADLFCQFLENELHTWIHPTYPPLDQHKLFHPSIVGSPDAYLCHDLKNALDQHKHTILIHHSVLLGSQKDMNDIISAFKKIHEICGRE